MTNEEFIKFEITDLDLENEFAPFRAKKLTKNQQIYGKHFIDVDIFFKFLSIDTIFKCIAFHFITSFLLGIWADDEEDDSDDNRSTKYSSKSKNYTAPVNFVAGGIHQPGKKIKETTDEKEKNEISKDDVISDSSEYVLTFFCEPLFYKLNFVFTTVIFSIIRYNYVLTKIR